MDESEVKSLVAKAMALLSWPPERPERPELKILAVSNHWMADQGIRPNLAVREWVDQQFGLYLEAMAAIPVPKELLESRDVEKIADLLEEKGAVTWREWLDAHRAEVPPTPPPAQDPLATKVGRRLKFVTRLDGEYLAEVVPELEPVLPVDLRPDLQQTQTQGATHAGRKRLGGLTPEGHSLWDGMYSGFVSEDPPTPPPLEHLDDPQMLNSPPPPLITYTEEGKMWDHTQVPFSTRRSFWPANPLEGPVAVPLDQFVAAEEKAAAQVREAAQRWDKAGELVQKAIRAAAGGAKTGSAALDAWLERASKAEPPAPVRLSPEDLLRLEEDLKRLPTHWAGIDRAAGPDWTSRWRPPAGKTDDLKKRLREQFEAWDKNVFEEAEELMMPEERTPQSHSLLLRGKQLSWNLEFLAPDGKTKAEELIGMGCRIADVLLPQCGPFWAIFRTDEEASKVAEVIRMMAFCKEEKTKTVETKVPVVDAIDVIRGAWLLATAGLSQPKRLELCDRLELQLGAWRNEILEES